MNTFSMKINKEKWTIDFFLKSYSPILPLSFESEHSWREWPSPSPPPENRVKHEHNRRLSTQQGRYFPPPIRWTFRYSIGYLQVHLPHKRYEMVKRGVPPLGGLNLTGMTCQIHIQSAQLRNFSSALFSPSRRHRYVLLFPFIFLKRNFKKCSSFSWWWWWMLVDWWTSWWSPAATQFDLRIN